MNTFDFIQQNFARYVLSELTDDSVRDSAAALTMSHRLKNGKASRLTGWAIIHSHGATVQAKLAAVGDGLITDEARTRYDAWSEVLDDFSGPLCLIQFTKSTVNISNIYLTYDLRMTRVCSPDGVNTFDYTNKPGAGAGVAHRNIYKWSKKNAA